MHSIDAIGSVVNPLVQPFLHVYFLFYFLEPNPDA